MSQELKQNFQLETFQLKVHYNNTGDFVNIIEEKLPPVQWEKVLYYLEQELKFNIF